MGQGIMKKHGRNRLREFLTGGVAKKFWLGWLVALLFVLILPGCLLVQEPKGGTLSVVTPDFFGVGEDLTRQLAANLKHGHPAGMKVIFTTMVNIDDLTATSRFGRTLSEALATQMFRHGFGVVEVRKGAELLLRQKGGELMLSREVRNLASRHQAHAVVVGTYSLTPQTVIINARLVAAGSQEVLSVAGLELQRTQAVNRLLAADDGHGDSLMLSGYER